LLLLEIPPILSSVFEGDSLKTLREVFPAGITKPGEPEMLPEIASRMAVTMGVDFGPFTPLATDGSGYGRRTTRRPEKSGKIQ
jgi:hypothetical protein